MDSSSKERTCSSAEDHDVVELKKALATGGPTKEQPVASAAGSSWFKMYRVESATISVRSVIYYMLLSRFCDDDHGKQGTV
jgi:hypothetical protein